MDELRRVRSTGAIVLPNEHRIIEAVARLAEITDGTCKTTFKDKRINRLIVENTTPHTHTEPMFKITFYSGMRIHF